MTDVILSLAVIILKDANMEQMEKGSQKGCLNIKI